MRPRSCCVCMPVALPACCGGEADADGGSLVFFAFEFDAGVVQFGDVPDDGESQSGAFCFARAAFVNAVEAFEYPFVVFGGNAYAGVGDFEDDGVFSCLGGVYFDVNLAAVMVVF